MFEIKTNKELDELLISLRKSKPFTQAKAGEIVAWLISDGCKE